MLLTDFDLFGHPVAAPQVVTPPRRRVVSQAAKRAKLARHLENSNNLVLFDELLDFLKAPLLKQQIDMDATFASDVGTVDRHRKRGAFRTHPSIDHDETW